MAVQYQKQIALETSSFIDKGSFIMGLTDYLPQLVDRMANTAIEPDTVKEPKIFYDVLREEDKEELLKFLKKTFFIDEPLNCAVQLGECKDLEDYCTKSIPDGCSFKACDADGNIAGVFLSGIIKKPSADAEPPCSLASKTDHEKFKKIMGLMDLLDTKFDIFALYPEIDRFVDGKILAVDPKYRGLGIAGQLSEKTIEFLRENQIEIFHILCTSHFSARVCEKSGFTEVFRLQFSEYVDDEGKQVLCPEKPHVAARIFTRRISQ